MFKEFTAMCKNAKITDTNVYEVRSAVLAIWLLLVVFLGKGDIGHAIVCIYVRVEIRHNVYLRYDVHNYVVQRL
jgi:hypothetical protein